MSTASTRIWRSYLTKDFFLSVPAKKKRVSTSRDIHLFEKKRERSDWQWSRDSIRSHLRRLESSGIWTIRDAVENDAGLCWFVVINLSTDAAYSGRDG